MSIGEVRFFFDDAQNEVEPLAYTPSTIPLLSFFPVPDHAVTASYSNFTTTPRLPSTLQINAANGHFSATMLIAQVGGVYTVTATDPLGRLASTTVTFAVQPCSAPNGGIVVEFRAGTSAAPVSYSLANTATGEVVDALETVPSSTTHRQLCLPIAFYTLTLHNHGNATWGVHDVFVRINDNTAVAALHPTGSAAMLALPFYSGFVVQPYEHVWCYSVRSHVSAAWTTGDVAGREWLSATGANVRLSVDGNGYFYTTFDLPLKDRFLGVEVTVATAQAFRLYLNGKLVREYCMGNDLNRRDYTHCVEQKEVIRHRETVFFNWTPMNATRNHLAVQIARVSEHNVHQLAMYVLYKKATASVLINGNCYAAEGKDFDDTMLFDNDPQTAFFADALPTRHGWTFDSGEGFFSGYRLVADARCFAAAPTRWRLLGHVHGYRQPILLHKATHHFTQPGEVFEAHLALPCSLSAVWLEVDDAPAQPALPAACDSSMRFSLADFVPFLDRPAPGCPGDSVFPPAFEGKYAKAPCLPTSLYGGSMRRLCHAGQLGEEVNACVPRKPSVLQYPETNYRIQPNVPLEPIVPTTVGAETEVLTNDRLPAGIVLDPKTGTISGMAEKVYRNYKVTVVLKNQSGEISTVLYFYCDGSYRHYRIIASCVLAGLTMLVCISLVFVVQRLTGRKKKHGAKVTEYGLHEKIKAKQITYVGVSIWPVCCQWRVAISVSVVRSLYRNDVLSTSFSHRCSVLRRRTRDRLLCSVPRRTRFSI